jgi:hypothetical protein
MGQQHKQASEAEIEDHWAEAQAATLPFELILKNSGEKFAPLTVIEALVLSASSVRMCEM